MFPWKLTSSTLVLEEEWTQGVDSTSWRTRPYLQLFSKTNLWDAKTLFYPNLCWEIIESVDSRLKRVPKNHITTTCAFFMHIFPSPTEIRNWKLKHLILSIFWWIERMDSALISSMEFIWMFFQLLNIYCRSTFF